jgi:hypothetical protein
VISNHARQHTRVSGATHRDQQGAGAGQQATSVEHGPFRAVQFILNGAEQSEPQ